MKQNLLIILCICTVLNSCKSDIEETDSGIVPEYDLPKLEINRGNINVNILLDLSDRISPVKFPNPSMDYYLRDVGHVKSAAQAFEMHVRSKRSNLINDKIKLFIDPEPTKRGLNKRLDLLRISFDKNNAKKQAILKTSLAYDSISKLIYEDAIKDNNYVGSDTWGFIKNRVNDYCIEEGKRNILLILTDGYIYHKDNLREEENKTSYLTPQLIKKLKLNNKNWQSIIDSKGYGYIVPEVDLSNLEVLVLGVNAELTKPYGADIITKFWQDWLDAMSVKRSSIKLTGLPVNLDKTIKEFILDVDL